MKKLAFQSSIGVGVGIGAYYLYNQFNPSKLSITQNNNKELDETKKQKYRNVIRDITIQFYGWLCLQGTELDAAKLQVSQQQPSQLDTFISNTKNTLQHWISQLETSIFKMDTSLNLDEQTTLMESDEYFIKKKEIIKGWIESVNFISIEINKDEIEEQIPVNFTPKLYLEQQRKIREEYAKRTFFDLLMKKLQNPSNSLQSFQVPLWENIKSNEGYQIENTLRAISENGHEFKTTELRAIKSLHESIHTHFSSLDPAFAQEVDSIHSESKNAYVKIFKELSKDNDEIQFEINPIANQLVKQDKLKFITDAQGLTDLSSFSLKGWYLSSTRQIDMDIRCQSNDEGDNARVWNGDCELLGAPQMVTASLENTNQNQETILQVKQINSKVNGFVYNLRGGVVNGWYIGKWEDDSGKSDMFCAVVVKSQDSD